MLEGLLILGVGAAIITVALFGTTIMSGLVAISASITAMFVGVTTGTANLLTSWVSWVLAADATTFYLGYIWFAGWIALFAYSAFKIATSDKKKWMNLVGRGSNYLGIMLILFLMFQPIAVSYGSAFMTDTTGQTEIDYNVTDAVIGSGYDTIYSKLYNSTGYYLGEMTPTHDNDTKETIVASTVIPTVTEPYLATSRLFGYMNTTFLAAKTAVTKVEFIYQYIGIGNITSFVIAGVVPSRTFIAQTDTDDVIGGLSEATFAWSPEAYQAQQLKITTQLTWQIYFDVDNMIGDDDYISITIKFYTTSTIISQETLMLWLGASMAALDIMGLLYASGFLRKYIL